MTSAGWSSSLENKAAADSHKTGFPHVNIGLFAISTRDTPEEGLCEGRGLTCWAQEYSEPGGMSKHVHGGVIWGQPEAELHFIVCTASPESTTLAEILIAPLMSLPQSIPARRPDQALSW